MVKINKGVDKILVGVFGGLLVIVVILSIGNYKEKFTAVEKNKNSFKGEDKNTVAENEAIEGGKVWLVVDEKNIKKDRNIDISIFVDTAGQELGVFNMDFEFDSSEMEIDKKQGSDGMTSGDKMQEYTVLVNANEAAQGKYKIVGMTVNNYAEGSTIHLGTIHFKALKDFEIDADFKLLKINELANYQGKTFDIEELQKNVKIK